MNTGTHHNPEFRGFGDWVEALAAGRHTDGQGKTRTWSEADLGEMVATHSASNPAPLVIGHPSMDAPAYGWSGGGLKREGGKLFARFTDLNPEVNAAARARLPQPIDQGGPHGR